MAIQESVSNNNRMPTPDELGKMAELYAPNVPSNFVLAVLEQESQRGLNKASHTSRQVSDSARGVPQSVIGPGQILDSPYSYRPEEKISLAAHFYTKTTGQKYQEGNLQHATIAALAKIDSDYLKAKGDDLEFSKNYFGRGIDKSSGGLVAEGYVVKLRTNLQKLGGLESATNVPIQTKLNTLTGANDPAVRQAGALAAQERKANGENLIDTMRRTGEDVISSLLGMKDAAINTINTEAAESVAKAAQTKDFMIKVLGFDPTGDTNNITAAGKVLSQNLADLRNLQEGLANAEANPIFAILNGMSGQRVSKQFVSMIDQKQKVATDISQSISQLHNLAKDASNIGMATVSQMSEASRLAKIQTLNAKYLHDTVVASGKTDIEAAKVDIKTAEAIKSINDATLRNAAQAEKSEADSARRKLDMDIKAFNLAQMQNQAQGKLDLLDSRVANSRLDAEKKDAALAKSLENTKALESTATKLGTTPAELTLALKSKDPKVTELVMRPKSLGSMELKASLGTLEPEEKTARNLAFGFNGWASPINNRWAKGIDAGVAEVLSKDKNYQKASKEVRIITKANAVAEGIGSLQDAIVNTKDIVDNEKNPYAANHSLLLSKNETLLYPVLSKDLKTAQLATEVFKGKLFGAAQKELAAGRQLKGDEDIINLSVKLFKTNSAAGYSVTEAAKELSDYFSLAMGANNVAKNFSGSGVPEQDRYIVNMYKPAQSDIDYAYRTRNPQEIRNDFTIPLIKVNPKGTTEEAAKSVNNLSVNMANEDAAKVLLLNLASKQRSN